MFALILLASFVSVATADNLSKNWTMAHDIPDNSPLHSLLEVTGKKAQYADASSPDLAKPYLPSAVGNAVLVGPDLVLTCSSVWGEGIANSAGGKKGFAFNNASKYVVGPLNVWTEFTEADIYEAEEVIFSLEDDSIGIDIALVRTEGKPGSKYGWVSIAEWPDSYDQVPLTNIVNDYYGQDKAANQNCSGVANKSDNGIVETVVWAQCDDGDDGGEKNYSGSGSGFFNEAGELVAIRCGTFDQMAQLAVELAKEKDIDLSTESSIGKYANRWAMHSIADEMVPDWRSRVDPVLPDLWRQFQVGPLGLVLDLYSNLDREERSELGMAISERDEAAWVRLHGAHTEALEAAIEALDDVGNRKMIILGAALVSIIDPTHIIDPQYKGENEMESHPGDLVGFNIGPIGLDVGPITMEVDSKVDRLRSHLKDKLEELEHHRIPWWRPSSEIIDPAHRPATRAQSPMHRRS